ncbi:unnamed protein product [Protopolystoma xenopodis]|uniref:Uncharacterized protein n=1 Tax=Protopolystoma xenopodis TaxID=117903 RepID=A0A448WT58_9PLAT|nr:unnamed protein product [Protopolystoma xenopodis]
MQLLTHNISNLNKKRAMTLSSDVGLYRFGRLGTSLGQMSGKDHDNLPEGGRNSGSAMKIRQNTDCASDSKVEGSGVVESREVTSVVTRRNLALNAHDGEKGYDDDDDDDDDYDDEDEDEHSYGRSEQFARVASCHLQTPAKSSSLRHCIPRTG